MSKMKRKFDSDLPIPAAVRDQVAEMLAAARPKFPPTNNYSGNNSERAGRGDPGHCEACAVVGHVVAHPDFGCADVQCYLDHS